MFRTEFEFVLPKGFVDGEGTLHREGVMRLATAGDEIVPLKDPRVDKNPAYLGIILLSRVVTRLGNMRSITTHTIESLYASDYEFLQKFYNNINYGTGEDPVREPTTGRETSSARGQAWETEVPRDPIRGDRGVPHPVDL